jgi:hypothetical protein
LAQSTTLEAEPPLRAVANGKCIEDMI